jgi:uncharacterized protein YndB with AHSA1/START domain
MTEALATTAEPEADCCIRLERVLRAPREVVFSAFSSAEHLARWWGPNGFSVTTSAFDFRPGGVWRFVMHGPDGRDFQNRIRFDVIEPLALLVGRHDDGSDAESLRHDLRITFEAYGEQTRLVWLMVFATAAERDLVARNTGPSRASHRRSDVWPSIWRSCAADQPLGPLRRALPRFVRS